MSILILGGAGFLGRNLSGALNRKGQRTIVYDRVPPRTKTEIQYYVGELSDITLIKRILIEQHVEILVHCVSSLLPSSSYEQFENELELVVKPSILIFEILAELKIKLVFLSSGGTVYGNWKEEAYVESDALQPINWYGQSKVIIEELIGLCHRRRGLDYLILRPSNPFGSGQNLNGAQGLIAVAIGKMLKGQEITIFGDGENVRDYIYVDDLSALISDLVTGDVWNDIFNVGSGHYLSINKVISILEEITGKKALIDRQPERSSDSRCIILDVGKVASITKHVCLPISEGIRCFYEYILENEF